MIDADSGATRGFWPGIGGSRGKERGLKGRVKEAEGDAKRKGGEGINTHPISDKRLTHRAKAKSSSSPENSEDEPTSSAVNPLSQRDQR